MTRRATIRTTHDDPALIARALRPDNTDEMRTDVGSGEDGASSDSAAGDGVVVTRIERETTGGLHSTVDDYVVNLSVAAAVAAVGSTADDERTHSTREGQHERPTDAGSASDRSTHDTPDNE